MTNDFAKNLPASAFTEAEEEAFQRSLSFIREIGIKIHFDNIKEETFLPGICIVNGALVIDRNKLKYPGDILHEAGHMAVVPAADRSGLCEEDIAKREMKEAEEMMAIAWSYAACVHLGIDATFVFHDHGYNKGGSNIAENFREGRYFGVPVLKWVNMCKNPEEENGYPNMIRWLRAE